jgi:hypothetical protein
MDSTAQRFERFLCNLPMWRHVSFSVDRAFIAKVRQKSTTGD